MNYTVYDRNRLASKTGYPWISGEGFDTATFNCRLKAIKYAKVWLGYYYSSLLPANWDGKPFNYSNDRIIEIKESDLLSNELYSL